MEISDRHIDMAICDEGLFLHMPIFARNSPRSRSFDHS
jgi:hypothetical protein